jgi:hypothetical protein
MKIVAALGLLLVANQALLAQAGFAPRPVVRSASGQFIIFDRRDATSPPLPGPGTSPDSFVLQPAFVTVSCERIKRALYLELGLPDLWRGEIQINLSPASRRGSQPSIIVDKFRDGWQYEVNLPERVERKVFVRTLVQVILLELANRNSAGRSAEIPLWLVVGLTRQLLISLEAEIILTPPAVSFGGVKVGRTVIERRDNDPLEASRRVLRNRPPPTIAELSWPQAQELGGADGEVFGCSAQLFVVELMRLDNGRDCLREMVNALSGCYNWQTAFLHAFRGSFPNQLALEKWWALQVTFFVERDPQQLWTAEESWRRLNEALLTPVAVRQFSLEMPARADVTLQAILREWDTLRQLTTCRSKCRELELIRVRVAPEFIPLTDDYLRVLKEYVRQRERTSVIFANLNAMSSGQQKVTLEVIRELDALDANRSALRPPPRDSWSAIPPPSPEIAR